MRYHTQIPISRPTSKLHPNSHLKHNIVIKKQHDYANILISFIYYIYMYLLYNEDVIYH